jgi:uncharacterized protein (UPF0248 family)
MQVQYQQREPSWGKSTLEWFEEQLTLLESQLAHVLGSEQIAKWPRRLIEMSPSNVIEEPLFQVTYAMGLREYPAALPGLDDGHMGDTKTVLANFEKTLQHQKLLMDNQDILQVEIKCRSRQEMDAHILDQDTWMTAEDELQHLPNMRSRDDNGPRRKFRTENEVMNRIQYDPQYDGNDYIIGYLDRFAGSMEMPFTSWIRETTDEQFMPLHRIIYFRHKETREIIWHREKRIDLIWN